MVQPIGLSLDGSFPIVLDTDLDLDKFFEDLEADTGKSFSFSLSKRPMSPALKLRVYEYIRGVSHLKDRTHLVLDFLDKEGYHILRSYKDVKAASKWIHRVAGSKFDALSPAKKEKLSREISKIPSSPPLVADIFNLKTRPMSKELKDRAFEYMRSIGHLKHRTYLVRDFLNKEGYPILSTTDNLRALSKWIYHVVGPNLSLKRAKTDPAA